MFAWYFENETKRLAKADLAEIRTLGDWNEKKNEYRRQLREMLGLDPLPERTPLQVKITGTVLMAAMSSACVHLLVTCAAWSKSIG